MNDRIFLTLVWQWVYEGERLDSNSKCLSFFENLWVLKVWSHFLKGCGLLKICSNAPAMAFFRLTSLKYQSCSYYLCIVELWPELSLSFLAIEFLGAEHLQRSRRRWQLADVALLSNQFALHARVSNILKLKQDWSHWTAVALQTFLPCFWICRKKPHE